MPAPLPAPIEPELRPVRASVFDDDFFRSSPRAETRSEELVAPEPTLWSEPAEPVSRVPSFVPAAAPEPDPTEPDELDIPAFLRRT